MCPGPFDTGCSPLSYSGDPGVNGVSHREGCLETLGVCTGCAQLCPRHRGWFALGYSTLRLCCSTQYTVHSTLRRCCSTQYAPTCKIHAVYILYMAYLTGCVWISRPQVPSCTAVCTVLHGSLTRLLCTIIAGGTANCQDCCAQPPSKPW